MTDGNAIRIDVHELTDDHEDVLAGATEGAEMLSRLISAVAEVTDVRVILLDFRHVHIATASFLRESVLGFRDYSRRSRVNLYPVLANANLRVMEELEGLLRDKGDAVVVCETTERGVVRAARVIGKLEEKQRVTLRAVLEVRRADAPTLSRRPGADLKTTTAWNNRLVSLVSKGILMETSAGRNKVYQPVLEVLTHGN